MAITEAALHAKRHKRVLASRSRIAHKARRDAQLRAEASSRSIKSAQWMEDLGILQSKAEAKAANEQRQAAYSGIQAGAKTGWLAGAAAKVTSFFKPRGR